MDRKELVLQELAIFDCGILPQPFAKLQVKPCSEVQAIISVINRSTLHADQVSGRIREFVQKAGIKASLHSLRHMHASLLLSKAVPITVIRDRLGHANSQVTLSVYSHVLKNDDTAALETWDTETAGIVERTAVKSGV